MNPSSEADTVTVKIESLSNQGEGIARREGKVMFVPGALPGETAKVFVTREGKDFDRGRIQKITRRSPDRQAPFCPHFEECGGCQLQHLAYANSLQCKRDWLVETFERVGRFSWPVPELVPSEPAAYRNKVRFFPTGNSDAPLGLVDSKDPDRIVPVRTCPIADPRLQYCFEETARSFSHRIVTGEDVPFAALVFQKAADGVAVTVETGDAGDATAAAWTGVFGTLEEVSHLALLVSRPGKRDRIRVLRGEGDYEIVLGKFRVPAAAGTFHQVNGGVAGKLYDRILDWAGHGQFACEAYCGTGSLALELAGRFGRVFASDGNHRSIHLAERAALARGIRNVRFRGMSAEEFVFSKVYQMERKDVLILDPPRSGLSPRVLQGLSRRVPRRLILVSCHPAALARDLGKLRAHYDILEVQPYDMFPQTYHLEVAALLQPARGNRG